MFNIKIFFAYIRENKVLFFAGFLMVVFFGLFFGYKKFYDNPNTVVKFSSYGDKGKETKEVEKTSKTSEYKELPYAEELIKTITEVQAQKENEDKSPYEIVEEKYGKDILDLSIAGFLPSSLLSEQENKLLILNGNHYFNMIKEKESHFLPPLFSINTEDYIYSLGSESKKIRETGLVEYYPYDISYNDVLFTNNSYFLTDGNLGVQGVSITNVKDTLLLNDFANQVLQENEVSNEEEFYTKMSEYNALIVNMIVTNDVNLGEVNETIDSLKLNDTKLVQSKYKDDSQEFISVNNNLYYLTETKGNDFKIDKGSVLQTIFIIDKDVPLYSETNYVSFGKDKVELRADNGSNFTQQSMYQNIKL